MILKRLNRSVLAVLSCIVAAAPLGAQPTLALIAGPRGITPAEYRALSLQAREHFARSDYHAAAGAYERLSAAYPWDGEVWWWLGQARYHIGAHRPAAHAFVRADALGVPGSMAKTDSYEQWRSGYTAPLAGHAARAYARAGEPDSALIWLEKAFALHHTDGPTLLLGDSAFASIRQHPRFQRLAGAAPAGGIARVEGWRHDLDFLLDRLRMFNPVYSREPLPDTLRRAAERLRGRLPALSDAQAAVELQHLLTLVGHAHNNLYFPHVPAQGGERVAFTQLPLRLFVFPEGVYVVDADSSARDLVGARVLRFGHTPAERALEATRYLVNRENDVQVAWIAPVYLEMPQVLHALGVTESPDRVELSVLDREGRTRTVALAPVRTRGRTRLGPPRLANAGTPPLWLSAPARSFWLGEAGEPRTMYLQFNTVGNMRDESLAQFGARVRSTLAEGGTRNLIVDMRHNNGGNTYFYRELLRALVAFDADADNRLYVLIGRTTFSAASNFITDLDRLTDAVFVGEPSSGKPVTLGGDEAVFTLPFSGIPFGISSASWILTSPRDRRLWIAPDVPVALSATDYFSNRDPVMDTVLELIRSGPSR